MSWLRPLIVAVALASPAAAPARGGEGPQRLHVARLHRAEHHRRFRGRVRHQGQLRHLRFDRDGRSASARRADRLRRRRACGALLGPADPDRHLPATRPQPAHELEESRPVGARDTAGQRSGQPLRRSLSLGNHRLHLQRADDPGTHAGCAGRQRRHDLQARGRPPFRRLRHHVHRRADRRDPTRAALSRPRPQQPRPRGSRRSREAC